jgi:pyruvate dehydrogenase phosphatase
LANGDLYYIELNLTGHLGVTTVEHVAHQLPIIVRDSLREALKDDTSKRLTPAFVSNLLSRCIISVDEAIASDVLNIFHGGIEGLSKYSDEEIRRKMNDPSDGGANFRKALLSMYGTTALVALVDPQQERLWIANLGDCQAGRWHIIGESANKRACLPIYRKRSSGVSYCRWI